MHLYYSVPGYRNLRRAVDARRAAITPKVWTGKCFDASIYLGRSKGRQLIYAGKVDHGFDDSSAKDLQARLKPLIC